MLRQLRIEHAGPVWHGLGLIKQRPVCAVCTAVRKQEKQE